MDEGVAAVRAAWGSDGSSDYVMAPSSAPVPIWFGGQSEAARRRAARTGDGWIPLFLTPDDYAAALAQLRRETEQAGRDPDAVEPAVVVFACVGDDDAPARGASWLSDLYRLPPKAFARHLAAGAPDSCAERLHDYAEAGARHIVVMVAGSPAVEHFAQLHAAYTSSRRVLAAAAS
jgi:alkanesulfonate monooxygenase SsuD/methylene tetrahydromethanopterin reductase-like flavin-dependent oxidoreductase (luciferase family)